jgi:hypothetical protein
MGGNYYEPAPAIPVTLGKDWQLLGYEASSSMEQKTQVIP